MIRSFLFVPGDSERKQAKALASAADAIIFDLEDSVAAARLPVAREMVVSALRSRPAAIVNTELRTPSLWVRINSLGDDKTLEDLVAVMPARPDGIVLPKIASPNEVIEISHYLAALEQRECFRVGQTKLLVIATETPRALLTLDRYVETAHQ